MIERYLAPAELRRLISALLVVLGFICLVAFFSFIVVPGLRYRAWVDPDEAKVEPVHGDPGWLDPTDAPPTPKRQIPPIDPKTVMTPNPALMARGSALYTQSCATCHGGRGQADGPGARGLNPPVRDFTRKDGWTNGTRIEDIYRTLEEGVKGSSMASYGYLSKRDRMALVHQVQSLGTFDHGRSDPAKLAALAHQFATEGETIPNHIPVRAAEAALVAEYRAAPPLKEFRNNSTLSLAVIDPARAATTLAGIRGWQTDEKALVEGVTSGLPGNGFAPALLTWTPARWHQLRIALAHP